MSSELRGFWQCLWTYRSRVFASWDFITAVVLATISATLPSPSRAIEVVPNLAAAQLGVASALFGIVLAGLAVIVAFLNESYVKLLASAGEGLEEDFFPFWFTAVLAVCSITLSTAALLLGQQTVQYIPARTAVFTLNWLFLWTVFSALNLVPFTAAHGINRALQILDSGDD